MPQWQALAPKLIFNINTIFLFLLGSPVDNHRKQEDQRAHPMMTLPTSGGDRRVKSSGLRIVLLVVGSTAVTLGVAGIFLPILPTTPFLLLAAACYLRSSHRFYTWLISHPVLSRYILDYLDGRGIPRRAKYYTLTVLWLTMSVSMVVVPHWQVAVLLGLIGLSVSVYVLRLPIPEKAAVAREGKTQP